MPNIKSAIKRVSVTKTKNGENKSAKSKIATSIKKFKLDLANKDLDKAELSFKDTVALLDSAVIKNLVHQNYANKRKAHFAKLLDDAKKQA